MTEKCSFSKRLFNDKIEENPDEYDETFKDSYPIEEISLKSKVMQDVKYNNETKQPKTSYRLSLSGHSNYSQNNNTNSNKIQRSTAKNELPKKRHIETGTKDIENDKKSKTFSQTKLAKQKEFEEQRSGMFDEVPME